MKYTIIPSKRFLKDIKRCEKRGYDMRLLKDAVALLAAGHQGQAYVFSPCRLCPRANPFILLTNQSVLPNDSI